MVRPIMSWPLVMAGRFTILLTVSGFVCLVINERPLRRIVGAIMLVLLPDGLMG